jgi:hypothetical protein
LRYARQRRAARGRVTDIAPAKDVTTEYGTAATTVRAFYYAFAVGDGSTATNYVIVEKRKKGAFSALALSALYEVLCSC